MRLKQLIGGVILLAGMMITTTACSDDDDDDVLGNWLWMADFDGVARSNAASFVIDGVGYVAGGYDGYDRLKDLWAFSPEGSSRGSWTQKASMPDSAVARNSAVAFSAGGNGYVGSGFDGINYLNDFWEYLPETNSWRPIDDFPGSARYGAVAFNSNGYGYVGCGYDGNYLKDFYIYDPTSDSWDSGISTSFPGTKRLGASSFEIDGNVYLIGGLNNQKYVYDFWMLDKTTGDWKQKRDIVNTSDDSYDDDYSITRSYGVAFTINSLGYYTTGESGSLKSDAWEYNPTTDEWEEKTAFEGASRSGSVAMSFGDRAFVGLGRSSSYFFDDMYEFKPFDEYEEYD
ncbi:Kelch repeat-containing protein [Geofilum sp. OHC36d9]|uniref:Kelch repeat-containing protein n=1 Tax=Geofilum sp. OHC36d9 TaxID=3458413 RepID=UPI0040345D30